jgi:hypothetical protein
MASCARGLMESVGKGFDNRKQGDLRVPKSCVQKHEKACRHHVPHEQRLDRGGPAWFVTGSERPEVRLNGGVLKTVA